MYAEIHAVDFHAPSNTGKKTWVNSSNAKLELVRTPASHLGKPAWYVVARAQSSELIGSGNRGGNFRDIERNLELHLTPTDLQRILDFALAEGLVQFSAVIAPTL